MAIIGSGVGMATRYGPQALTAARGALQRILPALGIGTAIGGGMEMGEEFVEQIVGGPATPGMPMPSSAAGALQMYRQTQTRVVPVRELEATNPITGRKDVWTHRGRPILYSGDVSAMRKLKRHSRRIERLFPR